MSAIAHCEVSTFFSTACTSLSENFVRSSNTNIKPANFFDQFGIFLGEIFQNCAFGRPIGDVENLGHGRHSAGVFELLAHHARHPMLEPLFDFLNDLGIGLPHRGHAADHRKLPLGGQPGDDVGRLRRRQVREDQGDGLRMLVDDERQQVLAIDFLQESERQGFDLLANVVERVAGIFAQRPFDEVLGDIQAPFAAAQRAGAGVGELVDDRLPALRR